MRHTLKQRIIALVLLMVYSITGTAVLPAAVVLAAWADGSHAVAVNSSLNGTQVRLMHRSEEFTPGIADHESALARVIVSFCGASKEGDHQICSTQLDICVSVERDEFKRMSVLPAVVDLAAVWHHAHILPSSVPFTMIISRCQDARMSHSDIRRMLAAVQLMI